MRTFLLLCALMILGAGCRVSGAVSPNHTLPKERASECREVCGQLNMGLGAVVVIMNSVGCVCEELNRSRSGGVAAAAGGAAIHAAMMARRRQQQQQAAQQTP